MTVLECDRQDNVWKKIKEGELVSFLIMWLIMPLIWRLDGRRNQLNIWLQTLSAAVQL
jgi:hypothetical protein